MRKINFPSYIQADAKDCGPTCLRIISKYYGKSISLQQIRNLSETTREGSSLMGLSDAAEKLGYKTLGLKIDFTTLIEDIPLPCICHWNKYHFVVIYKIDKTGKVYISDPSYGLITYSKEEFIRFWIGNNADENTEEGVILVLETTPSFFQNEFDENKSKASFSFLSKYLLKYKFLVIQLAVGLLAGSLLSLIFPFLTQSIVDVGIQNQDLNFIYLVLLAQIMLFIGRTGLEVIRSWILLHLSARINISIISDFFIKLMKLPISFFDTRMTGDIMQRINDHHRIEQLLTTSSLNTLFSLVNLIIFSIILLFYDYRLFIVYLVGAVCYIGWILFFLKRRKELDYKRFSQVSQEQSKVIELINGMQEIKLQNAEKQKRWNWEFVQVKLFKVNIKSLSLEQWQSVGGNFINQMKDILVSFLSAKLVLSGNLTLGMMLSVQYIIGQLNSPLLQLVDFIRQTQDAKISLERLGEIHDKEDEENTEEQYATEIPQTDIEIENVSFRYIGSDQFVFENLNLTIPYQKTTAIVGASGSGKTTLLKLLMKFYEPNTGEIKLGNTNIKNISPRFWREHCGVVMQDGYVFNDTIAANVAYGYEIDEIRVIEVLKQAHAYDFVFKMKKGINTVLDEFGTNLSGGQRQRIAIARALYKNPQILILDEATSALDNESESIISEVIQEVSKDKITFIIAHRLSTIKNANKIAVFKAGEIVCVGEEKELLNSCKEYQRLYNLANI